MTHNDIPSRDNIDVLALVREPHCVSIYTPAGPLPEDGERARLEFKNQSRDALAQLREDGAPQDAVGKVKAYLDFLLNDPMFWQYQSASLATFVGSGIFETFRLPHKFTATVDVADRFYIKPLVRTLTFPQSAYVLTLAQNSVRLVKVTEDGAVEVAEVEDLPEDMDSHLNLDLSGKATFGRGSEDGDLRAQQYTAAINKAVLPILREEKLPLIIASADTLDSAYRRTNSYKHIVDERIAGNPENVPLEELTAKTRSILDGLYAEELEEVRDAYHSKKGQGLASSDLDEVARAAVYNAIDLLLVDMDQRIPGYLDEETGIVEVSETDDAANYGVIDEVLRRALIVNGRVYAVRAEDMPEDAAVAATFRYQI